MIPYLILFIIAFLFIGYLYFQVKIKNNQNYPISLALTLAFLTLLGNKSIKWIIENINYFLDLNIKAPERLSSLEVIAFFIFLYLTTALYYKFSFGLITQKNTIFFIFQIGNNKQQNKR